MPKRKARLDVLLAAALIAVLATDEVRQRLALEGGEPIPGAPEAYAADIDREEMKWSKLVRSAAKRNERR
jgi:tripartite-type tricarboxylate transporter receptor subunit TctC